MRCDSLSNLVYMYIEIKALQSNLTLEEIQARQIKLANEVSDAKTKL